MRSDVTSESHVVCSIQSLTPCNPYISLRHCTIKSRGLLYLSQNYKKKISWHFTLAKSFFKILLFFFFSERDNYMTLPQENKTKLNAGLALRQRVDLLKANISANKISLP